MKTSVIIVAHNEEKDIEKCIRSIFAQTKQSDEIILVAHNCTDNTITIANKFIPNIKIIELNGPAGVPFARMKGFEEAQGDIIVCIDGDAYAHPKWLERIIKPLIENPNVTIVGGRLIMDRNLFWRISMLFQFFIQRKLRNRGLGQFASGANFACRKEDYLRVGGIEPLIGLKDKLSLYFWAEDYYLSQALRTIGKLHIALGAVVYTNMSEEQSSFSAQIDLQKKWYYDNLAITNYFRNKK